MSILRCKELYDSITRGKKIPLDLWARLPDHLAVAFHTFEYRWGKKREKASKETDSRWNRCRQRKAHNNYASVLQEVPHFFLIFIFIVSPRSCNASLAETFINQFKSMPPIALDFNIQRNIKSAAATKGVDEILDFKKWFALIFQKPSVANKMHLTYRFAEIAGLQSTLGNTLFRYVQASSKRQEEVAICNMHKVTRCALTCLPSGYRDDITLQLDVGNAHQLAEKLFPAEFRKTANTNWRSSNSENSNSETEIFFTQAQISEAESIFSPTIWCALKASRLGTWESFVFDGTRTKCISLKLNRKNTNDGVLYLCLASSWACQLQDLYLVEAFEYIAQ